MKIYFFIGLLLILTAGCARTVYLDTETPPGTVPPPPPAKVVEPPEYNVFLALKTEEHYDSSGVEGDKSADSDISMSTIHKFKRAYVEKRSPRIVVFLNRELSDEVREWNTPSREVISGKMKWSSGGVKGAASGASTEQGIKGGARIEGGESSIEGEQGALYHQDYIDSEERDLPPEDWMWQFEESFLGEFLRGKANIIDRTTIIRLSAAESSKQESPHELLSVKTLEMNALKGKADLFIELLVRRNLDSEVGYEFRATVKEIATGRILANVSSLEWKQKELDELSGKKFKATDRGYVEVKKGRFPKLERVASLLALDVMFSLSEIWTPDK